MGLTNEQYNAVMRIFDERRRDNLITEDARRERAFSSIPQLQEIDRAASHAAVERFRRNLKLPAAQGEKEETDGSGTAAAREELRRRLLTENGFPEDYLDPVYSCPACRDTGWIGSRHCRCFDREVIRLFYTQNSLSAVLEKENFQTLDMRCYRSDLRDPHGKSALSIMQNAVERCRTFADTFDQKGGFLYLTGATGRGKTFLTHCIAKELIDSAHSVIYYSAGELFDRMADTQFGRTSDHQEESGHFMEYLTGCDLLVIDDLGTEIPNSFVASSLFRLLNMRLTANRAMVISTNLSLKDLSKIYTDRISSRILAHFEIIEVFGSDIRIQKRLQH